MNDQKQDIRERFDDRLSEDERQILHAGQLLDTGRVKPTRDRLRWVITGLYSRPERVATGQALSDILEQLEGIGFLSSISPIVLEPAYTTLDVVPYAPNRSIDEDLTELICLLSEKSDAKGLVALGIGFSEREQIEEALDCFDQAVEANPCAANAWNNRGVLLGELRRTQEALESYDRAVEADPCAAKAWYNRGVLLGELRRTQEALESYDRAIEADPSCARAWYNRRIELVKLGRFEEAIESLEKTRELDPDLCD
jgi:tetratricopeptide (TPR) repeat protein